MLINNNHEILYHKLWYSARITTNIQMKNKLNWLLWILFISCFLVNEVSYNYASPTLDTKNNTSITSLAGCTRSGIPMCGTRRYVSAQEGLIDQIAIYAGLVLIITIGIRSRRKNKAPILFPPKSSARKNKFTSHSLYSSLFRGFRE